MVVYEFHDYTVGDLPFQQTLLTDFAVHLEIVEIHFLGLSTASEEDSHGRRKVPAFNKAMFLTLYLLQGFVFTMHDRHN